MNRTFQSWLALGGAAGPVFFFTAALITASLRPDYSHAHQFISELGETGGDNAWLMNFLGFKLMAGLTFVFALSLLQHFSASLLGRTAIGMLMVFAVGLFFAGYFSCDTGCPTANPSPEQVGHNIASLVIPWMVATIGVWTAYFRKLPAWRAFAIPSALGAGLAIVFIVLMALSEAERSYTGVFQRLALLSMWTWLAVFAWRVRNEVRNTPQ